ncbi:hypothetical protein Lser_V15G40823 [Lactuca serriola]
MTPHVTNPSLVVLLSLVLFLHPFSKLGEHDFSFIPQLHLLNQEKRILVFFVHLHHLGGDKLSKMSNLFRRAASQIGSHRKNVGGSRSVMVRWTSIEAVQTDDSAVDRKGYKGHDMLAPFTARWQPDELHPLVTDKSEGGSESRLVDAATKQLNITEVAFASFHHLEVLDLSSNSLVGSIPSAIHALSSLRAVPFAHNNLNGSLSNHGSVSRRISVNWILVTTSLKLFDISSNNFCEYIDFSHNIFEGSFSFSSFSNHIKLQFVRIRSDNDKFKVETEDPIGCIPMFQFLLFPCSYWCNSFSMSSTNITTVAC